MSLNDIFRSLFGIPPGRGGRDRSRDQDHLDLFPEDEEDDTGSFGFHGPGAMDDIFRHFHGDMQRQMGEIQKQMEDIFQNFGATEFPAITPGFEEGDSGGGSPRGDSLRDKMLKPERDPHGEDSQRMVPFTETPDRAHPFQMPSFFDRMYTVPNWRPVKPEEKIDKDLDEEIKTGDVAKLFDKPVEEFTQIQPRFHRREPHSSFRSMTIQRIRKPDGTYEEKKTTRDSAGNEETTVTRAVGDQSHSVTKRKNRTGEEEVVENFKNIDDDKMPFFEKFWKSGQQECQPGDVLIVPQDKQSDDSLFRKFFGPWLSNTLPDKPT